MKLSGQDVSDQEWKAFCKVFGIVVFGAMYAGLILTFVIATIKILFQLFFKNNLTPL